MTIVEWDWKEQPDFDLINEALISEFDGSTLPSLVLVPDTGSDQYALVVGRRPMTPQEAQRLYHDDGGPGGRSDGRH